MAVVKQDSSIHYAVLWNYWLKCLNHTKEEKGTIDLHRLALIADSIRKVSEGALQIRLRGVSLTKGRKKHP